MRRHSALAVLWVCLFAGTALAQDWAAKMFETTRHDFGPVARNSKAEFEFKLKNLYAEDVRLVDVRSSCGCTQPRIKTPTLKTYEEGAVVARINTQAFRGRRGATLTVTIDKPLFAQVQLHVTTHILDDLVVEPESVQFGAVDQGTGAARDLEIRSSQASSLQVRQLKLDSRHLAVEVLPSRYEGNDVVHRLRVRLAKDAPAGQISDHLLLVTNDPSRSQVPVLVQGQVLSEVTAGPSRLFMGVLRPGEKASKQVMVRAKRPFRITGVTSEDHRFQFAVADAETPKQFHLIPVTFLAGDKPEAVTQTIQIGTDLDGRSTAVLATAIVSQ